MYKISATSLNLMLECKRCFWLQVVKGIKRPEPAFPSLPFGMDRIIKEHFDRFMEKGLLPPEIRDSPLCNGCRPFSNKEKLDAWRSADKGLQYKDEASGVLLTGAIDNVLERNGKLIVLDYKTRGYAPKENSHEYYYAQMDIYNFLLRKNGYDTEDYGYLLFYYPKEIASSGEVIFDTELRKIKTDAERGERIFKEAIEILKLIEMPEASPNCKFCKWAKNLSTYFQ